MVDTDRRYSTSIKSIEKSTRVVIVDSIGQREWLMELIEWIVAGDIPHDLYTIWSIYDMVDCVDSGSTMLIVSQ